MLGVDLLQKINDFMESLDMDDETSATFEHLFVEEFDANIIKRSIYVVSVHRQRTTQ